MAYRVAAVDVHKKMLAVVVSDVSVEGEFKFERRKFGATPPNLYLLGEWQGQLRAGTGTTGTANGDAAKVPVDAGQGAVSKPTGGFVGRDAHRVIEFCVGSAGAEWAADAEGTGGRGDEPGGDRGA